jgi:rubrerythrin
LNGADILEKGVQTMATGECPKCHQPLETDESYICCADATLQWRCESCAKVSEGFAFPYGMCPFCGGQLKMLDRPGISDQSGLNAIRIAFQIELGGQAFYNRAAEQVADPVLKALFTKFSAMEHEHMETLSRRYHVSVPDPNDGFRVDLAAVQAGVEGKIDDPDTLFRTAIAFEKRAVAFFTDRAGSVPPGSAEQELYRELAAEEVEHVELLETEFQRWSKGKAGMLAS